jgi:hypothetical protein
MCKREKLEGHGLLVVYYESIKRELNIRLLSPAFSRTAWYDGFFRTSEIVYYKSIKRELSRSLIYDCRCDERLKTKAKESTLLGYNYTMGCWGDWNT